MIVFVIGGTRSGKSDFALQKAIELAGKNKKYFIATCPRIDDEIGERIARHQADRDGQGFETVEEQRDINSALKEMRCGSLVLLDCMTLWINNLLYDASQKGGLVDEKTIEQRTLEIVETAKKRSLNLVSVSNEVGMGLVPADATTRKYRDLVGKCNAVMAGASNQVFLVTCGIPLKIK